MTEKILAILFIFISKVIAVTGYAGIALLMAIESACIPLPSELIMPFGGYLVFQGTFKLLWVATAGALGCNLGSLVAYEIGCYGGRPLVERYGRWILMGRRELDWADRFFSALGISGRIHRPPAAGDSHIHRAACGNRAHAARTVSYLHISRIMAVVPWRWPGLGMKLGENWRSLGKYFHKFDAVIGVMLVAGAAWFVWSHWQNRMSSQPS